MQATRVLVVDDEEAYTRMVKFALEDTGDYEIRAENNPTQALQAARLFKPEVVVLDIIMPEMSGLEVGEQLKQDDVLKDTPIIFLTAAVSKEHPHIQHELLEDCPVLIKPVGSDDLVACINETLQCTRS
jgi:two-component system alkaline phosphatase synthesis response regulator PhoP